MSRKGIVLVLILLAIGSAGGAWLLLRSDRGARSAAGSPHTATYHCPMHPTVVSDGPGSCPICFMDLVPIEMSQEAITPEPHARPEGASAHAGHGGEGEGSSAPVEEAGASGPGAAPRDSGARSDAAPGGVAGLAPVRITTSKQQLIGVRTLLAARVPFRRTVRALGRVTYDERRLHHAHTKITGFVERLHANATGERVSAGSPLLEIYSPELLASQHEYLIALRARERTAASTVSGVASSAEELVLAARRRLELFDVTDEQIAELERTGKARRTLTLYAPITGTILARPVTEGQRVDPDTTLLDIADLSRVWIIASVYEYELPVVKAGQRATMTLPYLPGRRFEGRVALVYPVLDPVTRTAQVRLEFDNPDQMLRPEMFAEVSLEADLGERLAIPDTAVMETGTRSVVFVAKEEGLFEPREVRIGIRLPDLYEVLEGLAEGERVLTSANFYVDSESKLKAALAAMNQGPPPSGQPSPPAETLGHRH